MISNKATRVLEQAWFTHDVTFTRASQRTAFGVAPGETHTVKANVQAGERAVITRDGEEKTAAVTIHFSASEPLPEPADHVTVPAHFGLKDDLTILTARVVDSGNAFTPRFCEVTAQ